MVWFIYLSLFFDTQEVPGATEVRKGKSFKKNICGWAMQDWLWARLSRSSGKCFSGLACEMFHFLGTGEILNPQLKIHRSINAHSKPSSKIQWSFGKCCSEWLLCGSILRQQQKFKLAQEPLFSSVLLVLVCYQHSPLQGAPACREWAQSHQFRLAPVSPGTGASFAKMFSSLNMFVELMGIRHLTYLDAAINAARHV